MITFSHPAPSGAPRMVYVSNDSVCSGTSIGFAAAASSASAPLHPRWPFLGPFCLSIRGRFLGRMCCCLGLCCSLRVL